MQLSHFHSIVLIIVKGNFFKLFFSSSGAIMEYYVYQQNFIFIINKVAKFPAECSFTTIFGNIHKAEVKR